MVPLPLLLLLRLLRLLVSRSGDRATTLQQMVVVMVVVVPLPWWQRRCSSIFRNGTLLCSAFPYMCADLRLWNPCYMLLQLWFRIPGLLSPFLLLLPKHTPLVTRDCAGCACAGSCAAAGSLNVRRGAVARMLMSTLIIPFSLQALLVGRLKRGMFVRRQVGGMCFSICRAL